MDVGHEDGGAVRHWTLGAVDDGPIGGHEPFGIIPRVRLGRDA
jgi:hypothetical protein